MKNSPFIRTAEEVMCDPELFHKLFSLSWRSKLKWKCCGYIPNGTKIRFSRLVEVGRGEFRQIDKYLLPEDEVLIW